MHVLDTNVIIGFAVDFESHHENCQMFFSLDILKKTCARVINELGRIQSRRRDLYSDMKRFVSRNNDITGYVPNINIKYDSDKTHLRAILIILSKIPPPQLISIIDRKKREIESGIKEARRRLILPSIEPVHYTALETDLDKWVTNHNDSQIISDSVCWAEDESVEISIVSNDFSDIIKNREDIYYCVCAFRPYNYSDKPFVINSVEEIIDQNSS